MFNFEEIKKSGVQNLLSIASQLMSLVPIDLNPLTMQIDTCLLSPDTPSKNCLDTVSEWAGKPKSRYIYYFSLPESANFSAVLEKIESAKDNKIEGRAYPRINYKLDSRESSRYLYVGSSKTIAHRFKEHLGYGHKKTYAMHLAYWCDGLDLEIDLFCLKFESNTNQAVLQAFEDAMWGQLKPMLGRRGAR